MSTSKRHVVRYLDPVSDTWQSLVVRGEPNEDSAKMLARRILFKNQGLAKSVDMQVFEVPSEDVSQAQADGVGDPRSAHDFQPGDLVRLRGTDKFWLVLAGPVEKHDAEAGRTLLLRPTREPGGDPSRAVEPLEEGAYNPVAFVLELRS